jgi:acetate kinase
VLVFTAGIGENGVSLRQAVCRNLEWAGISLDPSKNEVRGKETKINKDGSQTQIWVVPTNEEAVVARLTADVLAT